LAENGLGGNAVSGKFERIGWPARNGSFSGATQVQITVRQIEMASAIQSKSARSQGAAD
jgi:hypothetical protein